MVKALQGARRTPIGKSCAEYGGGSMSADHKNCCVCGDKVGDNFPAKVKDSFYGLQYLCDLACWDAYDGWYCDSCLLLHDYDTTMIADNSCKVAA
jgi:hypothetical protein